MQTTAFLSDEELEKALAPQDKEEEPQHSRIRSALINAQRRLEELERRHGVPAAAIAGAKKSLHRAVREAQLEN